MKNYRVSVQFTYIPPPDGENGETREDFQVSAPDESEARKKAMDLANERAITLGGMWKQKGGSHILYDITDIALVDENK